MAPNVPVLFPVTLPVQAVHSLMAAMKGPAHPAGLLGLLELDVLASLADLRVLF